MINTTLLTPRNFLVIAIIAITWQIILSRTTAYLHTREAGAKTTA